MRSETGACAHESTDQETPCGDSNRHDRGGSVDNNRDGTDEHTQPLLHSAKTERAHRALSPRASAITTPSPTPSPSARARTGCRLHQMGAPHTSPTSNQIPHPHT